jgi:hypothetical protein
LDIKKKYEAVAKKHDQEHFGAPFWVQVFYWMANANAINRTMRLKGDDAEHLRIAVLDALYCYDYFKALQREHFAIEKGEEEVDEGSEIDPIPREKVRYAEVMAERKKIEKSMHADDD